MYTLSLNKVPEKGAYQELDRRLAPGELGLSEAFVGPVSVDVDLHRLFDKVYGRVEARAQVHLDCGRCLSGFEQGLRARFAVQFEPKGSQRDDDEEEDDPGLALAYYEGDVLPLGDEVRQELETLVPFAPLCRADCKGLCPRCGQDLNQGACGCPQEPEGGPFAALKDLKKKQEP